MNVEPGSFVEQARLERERLAKPRVHDFQLPGYTTLRVRYGVLPWRKTREVIEHAQEFGADAAEADLYGAAEILMECCKSFLVKDGDEWVPWEIDGTPVRYDESLTKALQMELPQHSQPRDVVYALFGGLPQAERPLMSHHLEVMGWMDDFAAEAADKTVGNSESVA